MCGTGAAARRKARISQAAYRRFADYYLTTDDGVGDLMREVLIADYAATELDPMRLAQPATEAEKKIAPGRVRLGPDWFGFVGNRMTEWERTGDTKWRDKILAGIDSLAAMPLGMKTGKNSVMGSDPRNQTGDFRLSDVAGDCDPRQSWAGVKWRSSWRDVGRSAVGQVAGWDCRRHRRTADADQQDMQTGRRVTTMRAMHGRIGWRPTVYYKTRNPAFGETRARRRPGSAAAFARSGAPTRRIEGPDLAQSAR